jgi:hypothetical protein
LVKGVIGFAWRSIRFSSNERGRNKRKPASCESTAIPTGGDAPRNRKGRERRLRFSPMAGSLGLKIDGMDDNSKVTA